MPSVVLDFKAMAAVGEMNNFLSPWSTHSALCLLTCIYTAKLTRSSLTSETR